MQKPEHSHLNWQPDISSQVKGKNDKIVKEISYMKYNIMEKC